MKSRSRDGLAAKGLLQRTIWTLLIAGQPVIPYSPTLNKIKR